MWESQVKLLTDGSNVPMQFYNLKHFEETASWPWQWCPHCMPSYNLEAPKKLSADRWQWYPIPCNFMTLNTEEPAVWLMALMPLIWQYLKPLNACDEMPWRNYWLTKGRGMAIGICVMHSAGRLTTWASLLCLLNAFSKGSTGNNSFKCNLNSQFHE